MTTLPDVPTAVLLRALAERHALGAKQAKRVPSRVLKRSEQAFVDAWHGEFSTLLLVQALAHAVDCGHPECPRCEAVQRRLEEPDLFGALQASLEIERLLEVEEFAREFLSILDDKGPERGRRAQAAAGRLRLAVATPEDLLTQSKYTLEERHRIGYESIGKSKAEVLAMAEELGVSEAFVYKWRKKLLEHGSDAVDAARLGLPVPDIDDTEDLEAQLRLCKRKIKSMQATISDQAEQLMALKRYVRERYVVQTKLIERVEPGALPEPGA